MDPTTNPDPLTEKRDKDYVIAEMRGQNPYQMRTVEELKKLVDARIPELEGDKDIDWKELEDNFKKHGYKPKKEGNPWYRNYITIKYIRERWEVWNGRLLVLTMARLGLKNRKVEVKFLRPVRNPHRVRFFQSRQKNSPFSTER